MKRIGKPILTPAGQVLPLSAAMEVGGTIYISGQLPMKEGRISGETITEQTNAVIDAIDAILVEAGLSLAAVAKTTIWLTRAEDFAAFNAAYAARFDEPYPARATVVSALAVPGALVEIEAVAVRTDG